MIYLTPEIAQACGQQEVFAWVDSLEGKTYRSLENRRTLRVEIANKAYFVKIHKGVGWREIFKNLLSGKLPVLGAKNEWLALKRLQQNDIATMTAVAYGMRGLNPAKLESFIITQELPRSISLEDYCMGWSEKPPSYAEKTILLSKAAVSSKAMHATGINHRDYYICHLHIENSTSQGFVARRDSVLSMIDLHRAQIRNVTPLRWRVKDIGGIYFSALDIGLQAKDIWRFMRIYSGKSLAKTLQEDARFWALVEKRAIDLYFEAFNKAPDLPVSLSVGK